MYHKCIINEDPTTFACMFLYENIFTLVCCNNIQGCYCLFLRIHVSGSNTECEIDTTLYKCMWVILESWIFFLASSLLVQLARDLQTDFYEYFHDFFDILVGLLGKNAQNPELLEQIFSALSYIFKFLWRYLVRDIKEVYQ